MVMPPGEASHCVKGEVLPYDRTHAEAVRDQVRRLLESPEFLVPERARRFLTYIVEETLDGRADRIKAFSVATDVLGRDASFDGSTDPVVRIEAGRVRRALELFYLTAGADDPIVITIPKGGYVPTFTWRTRLPPAHVAPADPQRQSQARSRPAWRRVAGAAALALLLAGAGLIARFSPAPVTALEAVTHARTPALSRLLVSPFSADAGAPRGPPIAQGLTDEVVRQLAAFREIEVVAGPLVAARGQAEPIQYELQGALRLTDQRFRLSARLIDNADGSVVWAENYDADLDAGRLLDSESAIAAKVATAVAQPYGVVFRTDSARLERETPNDWAAYQCTLAYYAYRADLNPRTHNAVESCLERTTQQFPTYATAWALLSLTYLDAVRFRYAVGGSMTPPIDQAFDAARRAVDLDPDNARALQAYMTALFFKQDVDAALKVGARAIASNPNDTELLAEYGLRLALTGEWSRGRDLMLEVLDRNPGPLGYYESVVALCYYMLGDYQTAGMWIGKAKLTANPIYHVIAAAIYGQLGLTAQSSAERNWFADNAPAFLDELPEVIRMRNIPPADEARLLQGLAKAGFKTTAS